MNWQPLPRVTTVAYDSNKDHDMLYVDVLAWRVIDGDRLEYMSIHGIIIDGRKVVRFT